MSMMEQFFPELSSDSESSDTSSSADDKTVDAPMEVGEMYQDSTEENVNNVESLCNLEKIRKLNNKIMAKWPGDDLLTLINRIKATLTGNDPIKFSKRAKTIVWDDIAFNGHSGNDCSSTWFSIQRHIRSYRMLKEMVCDAEQAISIILKTSNKKRKRRHPEQPKRPLSAYMIFCSQKRNKVYRENPGIKNTEAVKLIATMYNKLSEDDRQNYVKREEELKTIYDKKMIEFYQKHPQLQQKMPSPNNKPQTPFQIYYERQITAAPGSSQSTAVPKKEYKKKWKNMSKEDKIVYINLAVENERKFKKENGEKKSKSILSKEERLLSDKLAGKPKKPPHSGYGLFTQAELKKDEIKQLNIQERMKLVGTRWNNCSQEIKAMYTTEIIKLKEKYKSDYDGYLKSLPEEKREEEIKTKTNKRKTSPIEREIKKKRKIESPERNNLVKPPLPPSAPELFAETQTNKNINLEQAWSNLSNNEKKKYQRKAYKIQRKYHADFDIYLKSTLENQPMETEISSTSTPEEDKESSLSSESSQEPVRNGINNKSENDDTDTEDSNSNSSNSGESGSDDEETSDDSN